MISSAEFQDLARRHLAPLTRQLGLSLWGMAGADTFDLITFAGRTTVLKVGMDRAEDYRIWAEVEEPDPLGGPRSRVPNPTRVEDFVGFDLKFIMAEAGFSTDGLGDYGRGTAEEVEAALSSVVRALERHALPLLRGDAKAWHRLRRVMADRIAAGRGSSQV